MKYTLAQKIKILKDSKRLIKEGDAESICFAIEKASSENIEWDKAFKRFPQFKKYKPQKLHKKGEAEYGDWWFKPFVVAPRIKIINNVIKELEGKR